MNVVLDASGAVEMYDMTQNGAAFLNLIMLSDSILAPELYVSEVANAAWKRERNKKDAVLSIKMASKCVEYIEEFTSAINLWEEALSLAHEYDHSVYDMLYAALAKRHDAVLITLDGPLRKVCEQIPVRCAPVY